MLQGGDWLVGQAETDTVPTVIAYVPVPVMPSCLIYLYDATGGARHQLVESICQYVFENGAHKIKWQQFFDKPLYATEYGFTLIGTLKSEALSNDTWVDILLHEKLHPDWHEDVGESLPLVEVEAAPPKEAKPNVRKRNTPPAAAPTALR